LKDEPARTAKNAPFGHDSGGALDLSKLHCTGSASQSSGFHTLQRIVFCGLPSIFPVRSQDGSSMKQSIHIRLCVVCVFTAFCCLAAPMASRLSAAEPVRVIVLETTDENGDRDIQWFKDQMKISPQYLEETEGVMGMSWAHFFTMVFLVLFFIWGMIAVFLRQRRTKEILASLLKETKNGD